MFVFLSTLYKFGFERVINVFLTFSSILDILVL
jgi:hypothetical protein